MKYNVSNVSDLGNLQEQVKKVFCFKNCAALSLNREKTQNSESPNGPRQSTQQDCRILIN